MKKYFLFLSSLLTILSVIGQTPFNLTEAKQFAEKSEYNISWQESVKAFQSPNRNQNLRTTFQPTSVIIVPRVDSDILQWSNLEYQLDGIYRGEKITNSFNNLLETKFKENEIAYQFENVKVEYINSEKGLRQNFIISEKPEGSEPIIVKIKLQTDLTPKYSDGSIYFYNKEDINMLNAVLIYTDLNCWDAEGNVLASSIQLLKSDNENYITLQVNDENAIYPIVIDPLTATPVWVLQGNSATSYSIQYVASADFNGDGIIDLLTGAPFYSNGQTSEGIVKLHLGLASGVFDTIAIWSYESNIASLNMGSKIACAGDVNNDGFNDILIGANLYDNGQTNEGIVYMFLGSSTVPSATPNWSVESNTSSAEFGNSISTAGDVNGDGFDDVVIGSYKHTTFGRAFVYHGNATGLSTTGTLLLGAGSGNEFGYFVTGGHDLNNDGFSDIVITGRTKYGTGEPTSAGRIYVYNGSAAGIVTTASWFYTGKQSDGRLGGSAAIADVNADGFYDIITTATDYDTIGTNFGLIHVFLRSAIGYPTSPSQYLLGTQTDESFGLTIKEIGDIDNDGYNDIAIGSPNYDNAFTTTGRFYLFNGGASGLNINPIMVFTYNESSANTGRSLAPIGDVNSDGFSDFVMVNPVYNEPDIGSVLLYYGNPHMDVTIGLWNKKNTTAAFGYALQKADMNQDGVDDIFIGAPYFDGGTTDEGKLFVYWSNEEIIDMVPDWMVESQQLSSMFASSMHAGDFNGDGYTDIVVGAYLFDSDALDNGAAFIYYGNASHIPNEWTKQHIYKGDEFEGSRFGKNVISLGDLNADGYDDLMISAENYNEIDNSNGIVYIYPGSPAGILDLSIWQFSLPDDNAATGEKIIANSDINSDGVDDLVISSSDFYGPGEEGEGRIDLFYGNISGFSETPSWTLIGSGFNNRLGTYMEGNGDVNGDGYDDFLLSSTDEWGIHDSIRIKLYYGTPTFPEFSGWSAIDDQYFNSFGYEMNLNADVNGDGYDDIFIANPLDENGESNEGIIYKYEGGLYGPSNIYTQTELNAELAQYGFAMLGIDDLDQDNAEEMLIAAPYQINNYGQGLVYLYHGVPTLCQTPEIEISDITETTVNLNLSGSEETYYIKWKLTTESDWHLDSTTLIEFNLLALETCNNYLISIQSKCATGFSAWTTPLPFSTDCEPCTFSPTGLYADNITSTSAKLHWNADPGATKYKVSFRKVGVAAWTTVNATTNLKTITGLIPSSNYQYKIKSVCGPVQSAFSPISTFTTLPMREANNIDLLISVFPNPAGDNITIQTNLQTSEIQFIDAYGKVVLNTVTDINNNQYDISNLIPGMYLIKIKLSSENKFVSEKFIKF